MTILDKITDRQFTLYYEQCRSLNEFYKLLGYKTKCPAALKLIKERCDKLKIKFNLNYKFKKNFIFLKEEINKLLLEGKSYKQIRRLLKCSPQTISKCKKELMIPIIKIRYDWKEIQKYYDEGHSYRECMQKFGFCNQTWAKAKKRGEIQPRSQKSLDVSYFSYPSKRNGAHLKNRLINDGHCKNKCSICGLKPIWNNKPLTLHVDHINGNKKDNRLNNLRIVCPNCHQQTPNWGAKNIALSYKG